MLFLLNSHPKKKSTLRFPFKPIFLPFHLNISIINFPFYLTYQEKKNLWINHGSFELTWDSLHFFREQHVILIRSLLINDRTENTWLDEKYIIGLLFQTIWPSICLQHSGNSLAVAHTCSSRIFVVTYSSLYTVFERQRERIRWAYQFFFFWSKGIPIWKAKYDPNWLVTNPRHVPTRQRRPLIVSVPLPHQPTTATTTTTLVVASSSANHPLADTSPTSMASTGDVLVIITCLPTATKQWAYVASPYPWWIFSFSNSGGGK